MFSVKVDTSNLTEVFGSILKKVDILQYSILDSIGIAILNKWKKLANTELKTTKKEYIEGIAIKLDNDTISFELEGWLPNAVEKGLSPFDQKEGFRKSRKAKHKKDGTGWYLTIPFRHATRPTTSGMFSSTMPRAVYDAARGLEKGQSLSLDQLSQRNRGLGVRPEVTSQRGQVFGQYTHKTSVYQGIQKKTDTWAGRYVSFRRVSDLSDQNAFIHSGIRAYNLLDKAVAGVDLEKIKNEVTAEFFQKNF